MKTFLSFSGPLRILFLLVLSCTAGISSPSVERWRNGIKSSFSTIQDAINSAQGGDIIRLRAGVYYENIVINNKNGTAAAPIIIEGVPGEEVIIDGADQGLQVSGNLRWTGPDGTGVYWTLVPFSGNRSWRRVTPATISQNDSLMATYYRKERFLAGVRGQGILRGGGDTVKIKLKSGHPGSKVINIGKADGIIRISNSSNIHIKNIQLRHAGFAGIYLSGTNYHHLLFEKIRITGAYRGLTTEESAGGRNVTVRHCQFSNLMPRDWAWDGYKDSDTTRNDLDSTGPQRSTGLVIKGAAGFVVHNCQISGWWDGMKLSGDTNFAYLNKFFNLTDDMVELESNNSDNIRFYRNFGYDLYVGASIINNTGGNVYFYRNRIVTTRPNRTVSSLSPLTFGSPYYGYSIKMGAGFNPAPVAEDVKFFNNSFYSRQACIWSAFTGTLRRFAFCNNIFTTNQGGADGSYNNNVKENPRATIHQTSETFWSHNMWNKNTYTDPGTLKDDPEYVYGQYHNPQVNLDLNLKSFSPAINAGISVSSLFPGVDDMQIINGTDMGAHEYASNDADSLLAGPDFSFPVQAGDGLTARYFNTGTFPPVFPAAPVLTRVDTTVDFSWGTASPGPSVNSDLFLVRWSGEVKALNSGSYTFYTQSDDGVRLWVNGQLLIDKWQNQGTTEWQGTISLSQGKRYIIRLEYYDNNYTATCRLLWQPAGSLSKTIIPKTRLFSESNSSFREEEVSVIGNNNSSEPEEMLLLYPNPAADLITVRLGEYGKGAKIRIFNSAGKLVLEKDSSENSTDISLSLLDAGVYMVLADGQKKFFIKK